MPEATRAGFEEWVAARRPALMRTAFLLTTDPHDAEDLLQTTLVKLVPKWRQIASDPEPYARKVLATTHISRWRRRRWREVHTDTLPEPPPSLPSTGLEDRMALASALTQLSPRQRTVIVLRFYDDMTEAQTAALLGIGLGSVKSYGREALSRLRAALPDLEFPEDPVRSSPRSQRA